jgi:hypothetical protein
MSVVLGRLCDLKWLWCFAEIGTEAIVKQYCGNVPQGEAGGECHEPPSLE